MVIYIGFQTSSPWSFPIHIVQSIVSGLLLILLLVADREAVPELRQPGEKSEKTPLLYQAKVQKKAKGMGVSTLRLYVIALAAQIAQIVLSMLFN